jgi:cytochrome P450
MGIFWDNAQMDPYALIKHISRKIFGKCCNLDGYWDSHKILIGAIEEAGMSAPKDSFIDRLMGEEFTPDELIDNMKMLYFAGTETTGSLVTTAVGHLASNKNEQIKLLMELHNANIDTIHDLTYETLHKLKRLKAVIYESLRLIPPLPIQVRQLKKFAYFIDHFHRLRDFHLVGINPDHFNPDRFFDNEELFLETEKVFGAGLTPCIGKEFALTETLLLVASIILQGGLTLVEGDPMEVIKEAGAHLSSNLKIKVHLKLD